MKRQWQMWAAIPLLLAVVSCSGSTDGDQGKASEKPTEHPVYDHEVATHLSRSSEVTRQSGTSAFVATLTYGSDDGDAVDRTEGGQSYADETAFAKRTVTIPEGISDKDAGQIRGESAVEYGKTLVVDGDSVLYRTSKDGWLRFSPDADKEFTDAVQGILQHTGDNTVPYGGTLATAVAAVRPAQEPKRLDGGAHRYRVSSDADAVLGLLPTELTMAVESSEEVRENTVDVPLTVELDREGRMTKATADLEPLLDILHEAKTLTGVKSLQAQYTLKDFGEPLARSMPEKGDIKDAETVFTPVSAAKDGSCATTDTGMTGMALIRQVKCSASHDIRVIGQVSFEKTVAGYSPDADESKTARRLCTQKVESAPPAWSAEARPQNTFQYVGGETTTYTTGGGKYETVIEGEYTCFVATS